jgi:uncharacterized protein
MEKITIVLGASPNRERYSYLATERLAKNNYKVIPVGTRKGEIAGIEIAPEYPSDIEIDTIAMYLSIQNQEKYYDLILNNLPRRVVFNPGAENLSFQKTLQSKGVEVVNDCILVMLSMRKY